MTFDDNNYDYNDDDYECYESNKMLCFLAMQAK